MDRKRTLDFSELPVIERMDIFLRLESDVRAALIEDGPLRKVYERSQAALMFFGGTSTEKHEELWRSSAFLRAGLNEFYSIEEAARRDFKGEFPQINRPAIRDSANQLLHLMYLLRNVQVHAQVSRTWLQQTSVIFDSKGEASEHDLEVIVLDSPVLDQLQKRKEVRRSYLEDDLSNAANWLEHVQQTFGIGEVFRRGLSIYCRMLLDAADQP